MSILHAQERDFAGALREALSEWLEGESSEELQLPDLQAPVVRRLNQQTIRWLNQHSQFVQIAPQSSRSMEAMHGELLQELAVARARATGPAGCEEEVARLVEEHAGRLVRLLQSLGLPGDFSGTKRCVCAEYSLAVQLRSLGVDAASLMEPILDVGCGERGDLVLHLRSLGKGAFGVDRVAPEGEFFILGDWLGAPVQASTWGTIVSHQGFSNHFLHHHLQPGRQAERYALKYMEFLRALRPGGAFIYAPGLPFIESLLPRDRYAVKRLPISELVNSQYDEALTAAFGSSVLYSCQVRRATG